MGHLGAHPTKLKASLACFLGVVVAHACAMVVLGVSTCSGLDANLWDC